MTKIVVNRCYGGFSISIKAAEFMAERGSKKAKAELRIWLGELTGDDYADDRWFGYGYTHDVDPSTGNSGYARDDPLLVLAVETLGSKVASGNLSKLQVVEIPDNVEWTIDEYDGMERVEEKHRSW